MDPAIPEMKVLAIASHVVYGHVGNTMAAFVMQVLGCNVAALNTVQFSNHTGYKQFKGTKTSAAEISELYAGLKQSYLTDFDVLLSGYAPGAEAVEAVGSIARDLSLQASTRPGSFFWVLDPVMGDEGRLYVSDQVVPVYKRLLHHADLILPNQFELELLSDTEIDSLASLEQAITLIHQTYRVPHIIVTSLRLPSTPAGTMSVVGSSARPSDFSPRIFRVDVPAIDCFFSGTGDMFAALTVVRFREAILAADTTSASPPVPSTTSGTPQADSLYTTTTSQQSSSPLLRRKAWLSDASVESTSLPLARATEKVLGSMHAVLTRTKAARDAELAGLEGVLEMERDSEKRLALRRTKAAEVRVSRCLGELISPEVQWSATPLTASEQI